MAIDIETVDDVQARVARIQKEIRGVASLYNVKNADQTFLRRLEEDKVKILTPPMEKWLRDIEGRVFGDEE